jgi:hypothetical protein
MMARDTTDFLDVCQADFALLPDIGTEFIEFKGQGL